MVQEPLFRWGLNQKKDLTMNSPFFEVIVLGKASEETMGSIGASIDPTDNHLCTAQNPDNRC